MIAVDTNLLVYAHRRESDAHGMAFEMLRALAEGDSAWAIPWPCCYEFLSVVTNRRICQGARHIAGTGLATARRLDRVAFKSPHR